MNYLLSKFKMLSENEDKESSDTEETHLSTESLLIPTTKVQVLLRIKPNSSPVPNENHNSIYTIEDSTIFVKHFNSNDAARRSVLTKSNDNVPRKKFTFTRIFDVETNQLQFFNEAIKPTVIDFLNDQSSTIITYGTTNAGKTYTLLGTDSQPGIIPRSIELIYSSLNCTLAPGYKPKRYSSVISLDERDRSLEIDTKQKLLSCRLLDKSILKETYKLLENSKIDKNLDIAKDSIYSVWISFVEIYNDVIYDLLEVDEEGKNIQLKLATDKHGAPYIQGVRTVCATTGLEAYEILIAGKTRLSTTLLDNYKSSRSHSIFTIKLLKYEDDFAPYDVKVTTLTFYDLAGTGRIQKFMSNDKQFKESRSINTSLLALGRCLKVMADGNLRQSIGPFRDSKLTRLFQRSISNKENITLFININPAIDLLAETQNVLNFASTAMKLTLEFSKEDKKLLDCHTPILTPKIQEPRLFSNSKISREEEIDEMVKTNKGLLIEVNKLKTTWLQREYEIRKELADIYTKQLNDLEGTWKSRMLMTEVENENLLEFSKKYANRKRKRIDRGDYEDRADGDVGEIENCHTIPKTLLLRKSLEDTKNENKQFNTQISRHNFELSLLKKNLQKIVESINHSCENIDSNVEINNLCLEENDIKLDDDVRLNLSTIQNFIGNSLKLQEHIAPAKQEKDICTKEIQCNIESSKEKDICNKEVQCNFESNVKQFCNVIQELLITNVKLPDIDDSSDCLDLSKDSLYDEAPSNDLNNILLKVKQVFENVPKTLKLEVENAEMKDDLELLKNKLKQQDKEILQINEQYRESESIRLSLSRKLENIEAQAQSKQIFKNNDFLTVESENSFNNEECHVRKQSVFENSLDDDFRLPSFELSCDKIENFAVRTSSDSSGNDSGLASGTECVTLKLTNEKCCQTILLQEESKNHSFQDRLQQLKLDYNQMKSQHFQESLKVTELSQELERIKEAMLILKETTLTKERILIEYQTQLNAHRINIESLSNEKGQLEIKCDELTKTLEEIHKRYEKELVESQVKLRVQEAGENRTTKYLEDYWEKSVSLRSELSLAYSEMEKTSIKCHREHVLRIDKLEKELNAKKVNENELEEKICNYQKDLIELDNLSQKVNKFENLIDKIQQEKKELRKILDERLHTQSEIDERLQNLMSTIEERDGQIFTLKSDLRLLIRTNLSNSRKAKELGKEVTKLMEKLCSMKEEVTQSEEAQKNLELTSNRELSNLRARLTVFEENAEILNFVCNSNEDKQSEVDKLKLKLSEKDKELEFFKKNRSATIQRYECLVHQLQDALKMNHHSNKLKKVFAHKQKYFFNTLKECNVHGSEPQIRDWKLFNDDYTHSSLCSNRTSIAHTIPNESTETIASIEEPSRLVKDISEKSSETRSKMHLKIHYVPCKDSGLLNIKTSVEMDPNKSKRFSDRKIDDESKCYSYPKTNFEEG